MIIKTLKLTNFKCITNLFLDFSHSNLINILGNNGSGKSSIFEAISLCLDSYKKANTFNEYVKWETSECLVELSLIVENNLLEIKVKIPSKGNLERVATYKDTTYKGTEIDQLLEDLKIKECAKIMFYLQDSPDITELTPVEMSSFLKKLFEYDLDGYIKKIALEEVELKKQNIEKEIYAKEQKTFNKLSLLELPFEEKEYNSYKTKNNALQQEVSKIEEDIEENSKNILLKNKLATQKNGLEFQIQNNENMLILIKNSEEELKKYNIKKEKLKEDLEKCTNSIKEKDNKIRQLHEDLLSIQQIEKYNLLKTDIEKHNLKDLKSQIEEATSKQTLLENETQLNLQALQVLKSMELGVCPNCGQKTTDILNHLPENAEEIKSIFKKYSTKENIEEHIKELKIENNELNIQKINLKNWFDETSKKQEELNSLNINEAAFVKFKNVNVKSLMEEIDKVTKDGYLQEALKKNSMLELENLKEPQKISTTEKDIEGIRKSLLEEIKEIEQQDKKIIVVDTQTLFNTKKDLETQRNEYNALILQYENIINNNKQIEVLNKQSLLDKENNEKELNNLRIELQHIDIEIKQLKNVKKILSEDLPNYITVEVCNKLTSYLNDFIHNIFPNMFVSISQTKRGVVFKYYFEKHTPASIKLLSGFEKQLLSIAWKVVISNLYNVDILFLDEADSFGSEDYSYLMYKKLIELNLFNQLFFISHSADMLQRIKEEYDVTTFEFCEKGEINEG